MWWHAIQHWLAYTTGSLNTSGAPPNYNFFSGFGSDLGELTLIGGLLAVYKRHNCHVKRCPRIAKHKVDGTPYVVCFRHSPHDVPTHADVLDAHHAARGGADVRED